MFRSATKSLARLLSSTGADDDDIFVIKAIKPAHVASGTDQDNDQTASGHSMTLGSNGIVRQGGGGDYHRHTARPSAQDGDTGRETDEDETGDEDEADPVASASDPVTSGTGSTGEGSTGTDPGPTPAPNEDEEEEEAGQTIASGSGNDIMSGGEGADTFVFGPSGGQDVVTNFNVDNDTLDLRAYGFATIDEALSHVVADGAGMAFVIGADRITLNEVQLSQASDLLILFA